MALRGGSRLEHSRPRRGLPQNLVALSQSIKAHSSLRCTHSPLLGAGMPSVRYQGRLEAICSP